MAIATGREVAREIGFPWFNAALANRAVDTQG